MKGWSVFLLSVLLQRSRTIGRRIEKRHGDEKYECDDGEHGIEIDLHGESDWKCPEDKNWESGLNSYHFDRQCNGRESAYHVCIDSTIDNLYKADIPHSGPHRKVWAKYGEYNYIPPGRYVHNLEHGGVVFMHHPCASTEEVRKLRSIAVTCLYRHIVTAFPKLTKEYPFAVLTYGCVFRMSHVEPLEIRQWIREKFGDSPEHDVYGDGQYTHGLQVAAPERESYDYIDGSSSFCADLASEITAANLTPAKDSDPMPTTQQELRLYHKDSDPMPTTQQDLSNDQTAQQELANDETTQQALADDILTTQQLLFPHKENTSILTEDPVTTATKLSIRMSKKLVTTTTTKPSTSTERQRTTFESNRSASVTNGFETPLFFWVILCITCFMTGLFLGFCILHCRTKGGDKMRKLRVWSERDSADSFSVAAVVRKIPDSFTKSRNQTDAYHRLEANEQSSDEDNMD